MELEWRAGEWRVTSQLGREGREYGSIWRAGVMQPINVGRLASISPTPKRYDPHRNETNKTMTIIIRIIRIIVRKMMS